MKPLPLGTLALLFASHLSSFAEEPAAGERRPPPPPPVFAMLDANHDGVLTAKELRRGDDVIARLDRDGDRQLTLEEFLQPPPMRPGEGDRKPAHGPLPPLLAALDRNGDGVLSAAEIEAAAESLKTLDQNGDGSLSREEMGPPPPLRPGPGPLPEGGGEGPPVDPYEVE